MSVLSEKEKRYYDYFMVLLIFLMLAFLGGREIIGVSTSVFYDEGGNKLEVKQIPDYLWQKDAY